jgi:hypothetical protein
MTGSEPDPLTAAGGEVPGADTEGCRFVVASYEAAAPLVYAATADAARRIMMTPALGDFMELRFIDMGPRPRPSESRAAAAQRILEELLAYGDESGRNYFAIAVADRSAAEVELVLTECVNAPFLNTLPLWSHGIASLDDRRSANEVVSGASIAIAASGAWSHADLVDELRCRANDLLRHFAAGQQGLSRGELDSLRACYEQYVTLGRGEEPSENLDAAVAETPELPSELVPAAQPDILAAESPPSVPAESARAEASLPPVSDLPAATPAPPLVRLPRWLEPRWRRRKQPEAGEDAETGAPISPGLAYLLITGDEPVDDQDAWQRSRMALLRVDAKIATLSQAAYMVRALQGDAEILRGELRQAGQLSRRDVRHQVADADFAAVLTEIRALLRRDLRRAAASGEPPARPVVVFFAPDPPFADSVIGDAFSQLAQEASIIWVMPKDAMELLAPAFAKPLDVHVLSEHENVADEIADLLISTAAATTVTRDGGE